MVVAVTVVWAAFALLLSLQPLREHLAHFRPGSVLLLLFTAVAASVGSAILLRRNWFQRMVVPVTAASGLIALLVIEPWAFIVTSGLVLTSYGMGRFVRDRMGLVVPPGAAEVSLSTALGLALWICLLFWLGLAHLYHRSVFLGLTLTLGFVFRNQIGTLRASCEAIHGTATLVLSKKDPAIAAGLVFGSAQFLMGLIVVLTPALGADFLAFHLALARFYASTHALAPLPTLDYSFFPQGGEMLMTFGQVLAGPAASQMIPPIFFGLLLLLIPLLAHHLRISATGAALAIVFVASLPFLHRTAVFAKNDLALSVFQLAALLCYFQARSEPNRCWLRLGVIFLAASFAVKHVALFGAIPIAGLYLNALRKHSRPVVEVGVLLALFAAIAVPWHTRTFLLTGQPFHPMSLDAATAVFGSGEAAPAGRSKIGYLLIPLAVLLRGDYFFESASKNPLGMLFVLLFGVWLVVRRQRSSSTERACVLFALLYYLYWGAIWPVIRYAIVPILLLSVMASGRFAALRNHTARFAGGLVLLSWVYGLFFALMVTLVIEFRPGQMAYLSGRMDEAQYLAANDSRYASLSFLTDTVGPDDLILSLGNCAAGFAPDPARFYCLPRIQPSQINRLLKEELGRRRYRYVVLPLIRGDGDGLTASIEAPDLALVHQDAAYSVYRIGAPREDRAW